MYIGSHVTNWKWKYIINSHIQEQRLKNYKYNITFINPWLERSLPNFIYITHKPRIIMILFP